MKRMLIGLLACTLCLCGCGSNGAESDSIVETEVVYQALPLPDLLIDIPNRFSKTSSEFYEEYYICEDASIIVTQDTEDAPYSSVEDYSIKALVEYQSITTDLTVKNDEIIHARDIGVQILEFDYTIGEGDQSLTKSCMVGYLTDSQSMFIVTCKSNPETYDNYREDFLAALQSVDFVHQ